MHKWTYIEGNLQFKKVKPTIETKITEKQQRNRKWWLYQYKT